MVDQALADRHGSGPCPGAARAGGGLSAAGRVPVRRTGLPAGVAQADRRPGRPAGGQPGLTTRCGRPGARLGAAPLRWLFDLLRGPATAITAGPVRWRGLLVCAIDGTTMTVPDSPRNLAVYTKQARQPRRVGLPAAAAGGPGGLRHPHRHRRGVRPDQLRRAGLHPPAAGAACTPGMIVLLDRNFDAAALIGQLAATGADLLVRLKSNRKLPVLRRYRDGSYLSQIGTVRVRVIECRDHHRHQRRTAHRQLPAGHHPARPPPLPGSRAGHAVPPAVGDRNRLPGTEVQHPGRPGAARPHPRRHRPGGLRPADLLPDPAHRHHRRDRGRRPASTPTAPASPSPCNAARDLLIQAAGVIAGTAIDLIGAIGRRVLDNLLPDRRLRVSPRIVKRAISKYQARGPNINRTSYKATLDINILTPDLDTPRPDLTTGLGASRGCSCNPGTPALIKHRSSLHEPAASSSRSKVTSIDLGSGEVERGASQQDKPPRGVCGDRARAEHIGSPFWLP